MFKRYSIVLANDSDSYTLTYELESHRPAQEWASLMKMVNANSLKPKLDPWHGLLKTPADKINRLNELIKELNQWLPLEDRIVHSWDNLKPQESLNRLHIHFPNQEKNESCIIRKKQLSEFNDIIHGLEDIIRKSDHKEYVWLLVIPESGTEVLLNDDDYSHFHPDRFFGELCLHYPHVGRHPLEILKARDFSCPEEQILPQRSITTYHSLRFYNDDITVHQYKQWFIPFYLKSTVRKKFSLTDPKLAFGYITLGKLVTVNGKLLDKDEILSIIKSTHKILGWTID